MPVEEGVDFSQAILEEAKQEANDIIDLARREAERILDDAREELEKIYIAERSHATTQMAKMRQNQIIAAAEFEAQKQELLAQERLIDEVLEKVRARLIQVREDSSYSDLLNKQISEGVRALEGDEFEIIVAPEDRVLITEDRLEELSQKTEKTLRLSEQSQSDITGAIVRRTDKRVMCDNSFQRVLERREDEIRLLIAQDLFEEVE